MYRKDIDGLRALAVVPVVLFHAGFTQFSGGFVGVDVFFVISGFLITGIIRHGMEKGHYSVREFYERRIRRILPAFVAVTLVTLLLGWWLLLPDDFKAYGTSLWSSALFGSNIAFWQSSGDYFATPSEHQPLLHMWSLSVEEQFYIFFPLLIFALYKFKVQRFAIPFLLAIFLISLAISVYGAVYVPVATFYLLPTRAWELLAGGLLAYGIVSAPQNRIQAEIENLVGLALIVASIFLLNSHSFFPGAAAVLPVLGAVLILHAGTGNWPTTVSNLLTLWPVRFIGLISYSLYLWHWPIIVFTRYYLVEIGLPEMILMVLASVVVAAASWRYIEAPFRQRRDGLSQTRLFAVAGGLLATLAVAGVAVFFCQWLSTALVARAAGHVA